jgi:hypothetical protein
VTSDHEDTKNIGLKKMLNIAEKIEYVTLFVEHCENIRFAFALSEVLSILELGWDTLLSDNSVFLRFFLLGFLSVVTVLFATLDVCVLFMFVS